MTDAISRRDALKQLATTSAGIMFAGVIRGTNADITVAGQAVEIAVFSVSPNTVRITVRPIVDGAATAVPYTGALASQEFGNPIRRATESAPLSQVRAGNVVVRF